MATTTAHVNWPSTNVENVLNEEAPLGLPVAIATSPRKRKLALFPLYKLSVTGNHANAHFHLTPDSEKDGKRKPSKV